MNRNAYAIVIRGD